MTTEDEKDQRQRLDRSRAIALFRYSLVQEVISPHLTPVQWDRRVRERRQPYLDGAQPNSLALSRAASLRPAETATR